MASLLREPVGDRQRHSINSLGKVLGLQRPDIHRRLVRPGWLPADFVPSEHPRRSFPAREAERLRLDIDDAMSLTDVSHAPACTRDQARSPKEPGLIALLVDHGCSGLARREAFPRRSIGDLLDQLIAPSEPVETAPGALDVQGAAARLSVSFGGAVSMILDGRIQGARRLAVRGGPPAIRASIPDDLMPSTPH